MSHDNHVYFTSITHTLTDHVNDVTPKWGTVPRKYAYDVECFLLVLCD